jgi:uncharacterized lipoprotein YajG
MKTTIVAATILAAGFMLSSCQKQIANQEVTPPEIVDRNAIKS